MQTGRVAAAGRSMQRAGRWARAAVARMPSRRRRLALALAGIAVGTLLTVGLSAQSAPLFAPLLGTAVARGSERDAVGFAAGLVLGTLVMILCFYNRTPPR